MAQIRTLVCRDSSTSSPDICRDIGIREFFSRLRLSRVKFWEGLRQWIESGAVSTAQRSVGVVVDTFEEYRSEGKLLMNLRIELSWRVQDFKNCDRDRDGSSRERPASWLPSQRTIPVVRSLRQGHTKIRDRWILSRMTFEDWWSWEILVRDGLIRVVTVKKFFTN